MNKDLTALKPALVWKHFAALCQIPHPSHHEEKIRQYILDFAAEQGIDCYEDSAHNIRLRKGATAGMESRKGIILQAHLDMVAQKNNDKVFDFENDTIEAYIDGEWVTANGTTLGADNGIGVASALAVFEDESIAHGPIEALFTATEETGMDGAFGLEGGILQGDILLNLDSETEGELYVGCAGGLDANIAFRYTAEMAPTAGYTPAKISVKGLHGGHSGVQIICQFANANKLLFRLLYAASSKGLRLAEVKGGSLRNAIPREAEAVVLVKSDCFEAFAEQVAAYEKTVQKEYALTEESISITLAKCEAPTSVIPAEVAKPLIKAVVACPDGVYRMSMAMKGLVQTSNNLALIASDGECIHLQSLLRSSLNSEKEALGEMIQALFTLAGGEVELTGSYDGWNPNMASPILAAMLDSYESLYGKRPEITAIHAGLECGILGSKYPNLDMISFGPTIVSPHSPDERVEIASVEKFYDFLLHTLSNAPEK